MGCLSRERFEACTAKILRLLDAAVFANRGYRIKLREDVFVIVTLEGCKPDRVHSACFIRSGFQPSRSGLRNREF